MRRWLLLLGAAACGAAGVLALSRPSQPPNIVLIVLCSVRADQLGLYEATQDPMPWLTERGARGAVFTDAWTSGAWTRPSTAALMTGVDPLRLGITDPHPVRNRRVLRDDVRTLAEGLRAQGYVTVGRTTNANTDARFGFAQGFDDYALVEDPRSQPVRKVPGEAVVSSLLSALDEQRTNAPRFVFALFADAHSPVTASRVDGEEWAQDGAPQRLARYRADLFRLNGHLRDLEAGLSERGLDASNTLFVVVSDHGEGFGLPSHHGEAHGYFLGPSVTRMLWVAWGFGVEAVRSAALASQVDVAPTIWEYATAQGDWGGDGISQLPLLRAQQAAPLRDVAYTATLFGDVSRGAATSSDAACILSFDGAPGPAQGPRGRGTFIPGCFDRTTDPDYTHPVLRPELARALRGWWREPAAAPDHSPEADLDEALEALGYVQ